MINRHRFLSMTALLSIACVACIAAAADAPQPFGSGPLPLTCDRPSGRDSLMTITIQLTREAFSRVVFEHEKPKTVLPAGVTGQTIICTCVDDAGNIKDRVRLMQASGSSLLDSEALEVGASVVYPTGRPGCMRNSVNFKAPAPAGSAAPPAAHPQSPRPESH